VGRRKTPAQRLGETLAEKRLEAQLAAKQVERVERQREARAALSRAERLGVATDLDYARAGRVTSAFPRKLV
jgi:hypothetical protein